MRVLYVKNWAYHEHRDQRSISRMRWVRHKIDLGSDDWVTLTEEAEDPLLVLGTWDVVLKLAALSPVRGWLLTDASDPWRVRPFAAGVVSHVSQRHTPAENLQKSAEICRNLQKSAGDISCAPIGRRTRLDDTSLARGIAFLLDVLGWIGEVDLDHETIVSAVLAARDGETQPLDPQRLANSAKNLQKSAEKSQESAEFCEKSAEVCKKTRLEGEGDVEKELTHRARARAGVRAREATRAGVVSESKRQEERRPDDETPDGLERHVPQSIPEDERLVILAEARRPNVRNRAAFIRSAVRARWYRGRRPPDRIPGLRDVAESWLDWAKRVEGNGMTLDAVMGRMAPHADVHGADAIMSIIDEVGNATTPDRPSSIWRHLEDRLPVTRRMPT